MEREELLREGGELVIGWVKICDEKNDFLGCSSLGWSICQFVIDLFAPWWVLRIESLLKYVHVV